jgi:hypothetical protein
MNSRFVKLFTIAAVLLAATAFVASAAPVGRPAAITPDLSKFFADRGVDPSYLGKAKSEVPADQWSKIEAIVNTPEEANMPLPGQYVTWKVDRSAVNNPIVATTYDGRTIVIPNDHDVLNSLVADALSASYTKDFDPVYLRLGDSVWTSESGDTTDAAWIAY